MATTTRVMHDGVRARASMVKAEVTLPGGPDLSDLS
jgi:hypothetical protein